MGILQQASGTFSGASPFTVALPGASSASSRIVLFVTGNTIINTPDGFTLRTSQVNYMGQYAYDRAGGTSSWTVTPISSAGNAGLWYVAEVENGVFDNAWSGNNVNSGTTYDTGTVIPSGGQRIIFANVGSLHDGGAWGDSAVESWSGGYVEQFDLFNPAADRPQSSTATLEVVTDGTTSWPTTATFITPRIGRSMAVMAFATSATVATPSTSGVAGLSVGLAGAASPSARSTGTAGLSVGLTGAARTLANGGVRPLSVNISITGTPKTVALGGTRTLPLSVGFTGAAKPIASTFGSLPMTLGATGSTSLVPATTGVLPLVLGATAGTATPVFTCTGAMPLGLGLSSSSSSVLTSQGTIPLAIASIASTAPTAISAGQLPVAFTITGSGSSVGRAAGALPLVLGATGVGVEVPLGSVSGMAGLALGLTATAVPVARSTGQLPLNISTGTSAKTLASSLGQLGLWLNLNGGATSGTTVTTTGMLPIAIALPAGTATTSAKISSALPLLVPLNPSVSAIARAAGMLALQVGASSSHTVITPASTTGTLPLVLGIAGSIRTTPATTGVLPLVLGTGGVATTTRVMSGNLPLAIGSSSTAKIPSTGEGKVFGRDGRVYIVYTNVGGVLKKVTPNFRTVGTPAPPLVKSGARMPTTLDLTATARPVARTSGALSSTLGFTGEASNPFAPVPAPTRIASFGPNGTHWPERTPWKGAAAATVIDVDPTWAAIGGTLDILTAEQVAAGVHIRIRPGVLSSTSNGGGATSTPVLQNKGSLDWSKRVLVYPRDGYGSVTITGQVRYLSLYNIALGGLKFTNLTGGGWLASDCTNSAFFWTRQAYFGVYSIDGRECSGVELVEIVNPEAINRDSDMGAFRTGSAANSGLRGIRTVGSYLAPCYLSAGSSGHTDTLQHSNQGGNFYGEFSMQDTMVGSSTNSGVQIGSANGWAADHVLIVGGNETAARMWPRDASRKQDSSHAAVNGGGTNMTAKDSIFIGAMGSAGFTSVENSKISYPWGSGAGFTLDTSLADLTAAEFFTALAPKPTDARLAAIWA